MIILQIDKYTARSLMKFFEVPLCSTQLEREALKKKIVSFAEKEAETTNQLRIFAFPI